MYIYIYHMVIHPLLGTVGVITGQSGAPRGFQCFEPPSPYRRRSRKCHGVTHLSRHSPCSFDARHIWSRNGTVWNGTLGQAMEIAPYMDVALLYIYIYICLSVCVVIYPLLGAVGAQKWRDRPGAQVPR